MECSRSAALRFAFLATLLDGTALGLSITALLFPTWIVQGPCNDDCDFSDAPITVAWDTQIGFSYSVLSWVRNDNFNLLDISQEFEGWDLSKNQLQWSDLSTESVCNQSTLIYRNWSEPYNICPNGKYQPIGALNSGILGLLIILIGLCFFSLFFGVATPFVHGTSYAATSACFAILAFTFAATILFYFISIDYVRLHTQRQISTVPVLAIYKNGIDSRIVPLAASFNYGASFAFIILCMLLEFTSSLITWASAGSLRNRPHKEHHHSEAQQQNQGDEENAADDDNVHALEYHPHSHQGLLNHKTLTPEEEDYALRYHPNGTPPPEHANHNRDVLHHEPKSHLIDDDEHTVLSEESDAPPRNEPIHVDLTKYTHERRPSLLDAT